MSDADGSDELAVPSGTSPGDDAETGDRLSELWDFAARQIARRWLMIQRGKMLEEIDQATDRQSTSD